MPAAFRPTGGHFTQAMRNKGTLRLNGADYPIDGYCTRDRSWGDERTEALLPIPPVSWHVIVFGDDLAVHVMAFDSPSGDPLLARHYPDLTDDNNFLWGYLWMKGALLGVKSCAQFTHYADDRIRPERIRLELTDEHGGVHHLNGIRRASCHMPAWPNMHPTLCLTQWEMDGRSG